MAASTDRPQILYSVRAQRGPVLRCKGWKQETILRLLENNMENAEHPERLIIYGGIGKCARNWESYWALVDALQAITQGQLLAYQLGRVKDAGRIRPQQVSLAHSSMLFCIFQVTKKRPKPNSSRNMIKALS